MQKMFHGKSMAVIEVQPITETQIIIADVNVVDVNGTTRNKITEKLMFKDKRAKESKECC
jgi:ribosomal protein L24